MALGRDAASIKPVFQTSNNAIYAFEVLPLKSDLPQCVVNMMETKNGQSPPSVVERFHQISNLLT